MQGPVSVVAVIKVKCEGPFQVTDIERAKISAIVQGVVWFTLVQSRGRSVTGPMIFEKSKFF
jgi:hypothetical protein